MTQAELASLFFYTNYLLKISASDIQVYKSINGSKKKSKQQTAVYSLVQLVQQQFVTIADFNALQLDLRKKQQTCIFVPNISINFQFKLQI